MKKLLFGNTTATSDVTGHVEQVWIFSATGHDILNLINIKYAFFVYCRMTDIF